MDLLRKNGLLEYGRKASFVYLALRLTVVGVGFMRKSFISGRGSVLKPMCLSLSLTNIYMFIYLENAISRKNIEQCKAYWAIALMATLEASVVIETLFKFHLKEMDVMVLSFMYLGLCFCEVVRVHFICKEYGDMFEWFYFKYTGACTKTKIAYKTRARYEATKFLMILMAIQGVYLQIEGLKCCPVGSMRMMYIVLDHSFEIAMLFLMFVRQNEEDEEQRMLLIMIVALNISYCVFQVTLYKYSDEPCWSLRRFFIIRNIFEGTINTCFLYYCILDYRYFGSGLKEVFFPTGKNREVLRMEEENVNLSIQE
ncbi:ECU08_0950 [Encephalitozoon cuniculi GB-M1]|uniref:ECU08_0950 protein n=1 Tax=Encephalitozoon cuniculi (strain GB-M1) TaxID=284813 RepID=Q8SUQ2_ENCCU|nr:uncharacterized protein ECU08_0950 [Encephalitozoon cuniculi GB-M1]KMV65623.1 hypothetical protein M970_080980 [Encephalitozoon cuniculi EcunIII-L]CAD26401.2 ECU08_0950 [Encephalitozoon cuniculi GB-M1]